jgi:regulator of sigma E protease
VVSLIALGILIFIHELGHFLVAKAVGVGVERFAGFRPRVWSFRRGETEYCLSVVPLGGYVKMVGERPTGRRRSTRDGPVR